VIRDNVLFFRLAGTAVSRIQEALGIQAIKMSSRSRTTTAFISSRSYLSPPGRVRLMVCGLLVAQAPTPGELANQRFQDQLKGPALLSALGQGGYVIYFRHASTVRDYADQADPHMSLGDCTTQRKLSTVGIQEAREIGASFTIQSIPVGLTITSEYWRAWQTGNLAFCRLDRKDSQLNFLPYADDSDELVGLMEKNVTPILSAVPAPGTNTVIVGHADPFEAATGA
jgi:phosphohistidine phosphatase SixA